MNPSRILCGARRLPLTTKQGHNYYKGTRTGRTGTHTKHGGYIVDWSIVRTYPAPTSTHLTPFVSRKVLKSKSERPAGITYFSGKQYLANWKLDNSDEPLPGAADQPVQDLDASQGNPPLATTSTS
ncbi:60S ribosomal protein L27, mitochondrial [Savitreella phatthalungensis]